MNYQKIYDDICKRGQVRILPKEVYTETHHIIPKCLGGTNEKSNLTVLTAREHYLVHLILARKLYPKNPKLWSAMHYMINRKSSHGFRYVGTSKNYEKIRIEVNLNRSGIKRSQEFKDNQSRTRTGIKRTPEQLIKILENPAKGVRVVHIESGLIFNSGSQACSYFKITKDILKTRIKHGIFKILPKDKQRLTYQSFIYWLQQYLNEFNDKIDINEIQKMIDKIKN